MPTKEEREAAERDKEWRKAVHEHAETIVSMALNDAHLETGEQGGLTVRIAGPDGEYRRYFVRLTECR